MIRVRLKGRFGNQMFQVAFAYITAKRFKTSFVLDAFHQPFDLSYFRFPFPHSLLRYKIIARIYNRVQRLFTFTHTVTNLDCTVPFQEDVVRDDTDYSGYFQEGNLYAPWRRELIALFTVRKRFRKAFEQSYPEVTRGEKTLVVSVRLGDYKQYRLTEYDNAEILLPLSWYIKQLTSLPYQDYHVYVISDEIETVQTHFETHGISCRFVKDSVIQQFQLLQHADVAIIPNSTFAWWASFLNVRKTSRIIAPEFFLGYWAGREFPVGIQHVDFEWRR